MASAGRSSTTSCAATARSLCRVRRARSRGKDVRKLALANRKRLLRAIVPRRSSSVLYAQHIDGRGRELFGEICAHDLEGIVTKHRGSSYGADEPRQWIKVKNAAYSRAVDRHELFER